MALMGVQSLVAQVIPFTMEEEQNQQNTPEGWNAVQLPQNLPTLTESNTFYITNYGASTESADNTTAIQAALNAVPSAGGMVVVPAGTWMFGRIQIKSKTILHLCAGATLKLLAYEDQTHTSKTPYISNKNNACDIVIEGEGNTSVIDGQGAPWWDAVEQKEEGLQRGSLIRFENGNGSRFLFRNFRMQNAPSTNLTLGNSGRGTHNTVHDISIYAPASHDVADPSHNTDGIPIWAPYANIYNCDIDTGDDNVVTDSNAQFIHVWDCNFKAGHGASLGSYTTNMHDIIYENLTFDGTDCGFRLKSNTDRSGDVYNLVFRNCTLNNVMNPVQITAWYDKLPDSPAAAAASPSAVTSTTPKFRDILIQNVTVSGYNTRINSPKNGYGIFIYGRPESLVKNVTFDNVKIQHGKGLKMNFCEGVQFINDCSYKDTKTGAASTEESVAALIEESYQCSYLWKGYEPEVVLNTTTSLMTKDDPSPYAFTNGYTISNANGKKYGSGNGNTIKYSAGVQYTISGLPEGKAIYGVTITGYGNVDDQDCYLAELNGTSYDATQYVFANRKRIDTTNPANYNTYTIDFSTPVTDNLTFTSGNAQACWSITLNVREQGSPAGISDASCLMNHEQLIMSHDVYDLQGRRIARPVKGLYIINGKKVVIK